MQENFILSTLKQQTAQNWLIDRNNTQFYALVEQLITQLTSVYQQSLPPKILLAEANPHRFLALFFACVALNYPVFLANPHWQTKEWEEVDQLVQPNLIWNQTQQTFQKTSYPPTLSPGTIMIPTGGSSGQIRFAMHNWYTLSASVYGFADYFKQTRVNSCCLLPLYHVSGLMQCLRSFLTGGKLLILSYTALKNGVKYEFNSQNYFLSLVPTQLQFFLESGPLWLSRFQTILIGGAPPWQTLLNQAREYHIPLALTYGMTETASQIVTLKPQDFLQGNNSTGQVLPHARVKICNENGDVLTDEQIGMISIQADSLCLGYYPYTFPKRFCFYSNDLGWFNDQGYLTIVGRNNRSIITGGETVFPQEVENAILETGLVRDVCVLGLEDYYWGEIITAVYVSKTLNQGHQVIAKEVKLKLSKYKCPKYWLEIDYISRNSLGKIDYQRLKQWVVTQLQV